MPHWFILHLDTEYADEGLHIVIVQAQWITTKEFFILDSNEPVREPLRRPVFDEAPIFPVPAGIAFTSQVTVCELLLKALRSEEHLA